MSDDFDFDLGFKPIDVDETEHPVEVIGETSRGYTIFRQLNIMGSYRYWSDAIGGGVVIWDTALTSIEELEFAIKYEKEHLE